MKGFVGLLACAVCTGLPVPAVAAGHAADAADAAATRAYLSAAASYANAAYPLVGARIAVMEADEREVAARCPSAFIYAPATRRLRISAKRWATRSGMRAWRLCVRSWKRLPRRSAA